MKVYVKGQGEVSLSKSNFVGSGGEGDVYAKGSAAYKIYHDPKKMLPVGKITELSAITDPDIVRPEHVLMDKKGRPIGYTMRFLKGTVALCQLFPPAFRQRNSITPQQTLDLVLSLQERVVNTHKAGILVVDLNEMNYVVDSGFSRVYAIDVDSYQTPHYAATAIMPNIRDPQVQNLNFTELSDWFSFACISFNLFTGIHPYKGRHPAIKGFEDRMAAGISVFNPEVKMPKVVLPFDVIPDAYRQWYKAVLEDGKRMPPPGGVHGALVVIPTVRVVSGTDKIDIGDLLDFGGDVQGFWDHAGTPLVWTNEGVYYGKRRLYGEVKGVAGVGFTPKMARAVIAGRSGGMLKLLDASSGNEISVNLRADAVMSHGGRIYVQNKGIILEVVLTDAGSRVVASTKPSCSCLEHATRLYPGVALQDLLGARWASLFPSSGHTYQLHLPELDGYKIVDAKYDNTETEQAQSGVLMVIGAKGGQYDRLIFRFDPSFREYDVRVVEDVIPTGLNFTVLDTGVCVCMTEEEKLELFSVRKGSSGVKVVEDPVLGGDMTLGKVGGRVVFPRGKKLQTMRMK